tara:strand:+ start:169424 stop:169711 length:288 start_codon:yes stop_codon:yes gene_type:complete
MKPPKNFTKVTAVLKLLSMCTIFASVFILIWDGWDLAWRVGLTGIASVLILAFIVESVKVAYKPIEHVDDTKESKPISKFQQKLEDMIENRNQKN